MSAAESGIGQPSQATGTTGGVSNASRVKLQLAGILRLELGKNLFSWRAFGMYLFAFGPVLLVTVRVLFWAMGFIEEEDAVSGAATAFAHLFELYLRVSVFFSALFLFMNLFRSEVQERTLHYYLLAPVRREVLALGKYLSALVAVTATFLLSTTLLYLLLLLPSGVGSVSEYILHGPGLGHLAAYWLIVILACLGYGSFFLLLGIAFRNPLGPAVTLWVWEMINGFLPAMLKKISVLFYLRSLYPIPLEAKLFAVLADPVPVWVTLPGLLLMTAVVLFLAARTARSMEVNYGDD